MIYVTSGYKNGIGLEVFIKSFLLINCNAQKIFILFSKKSTLKKTLSSLKIKYSFSKNELLISKVRLKIQFLNETGKNTETIQSLLEILKVITSKDILITLPSTKGEFLYNKKNYLGHMEFFRFYFKNKNLPMFFYKDNLSVLLISDHIKLSEVSKITTNQITSKLELTLKSLATLFPKKFTPEEILISGINPHAGEMGILGIEDKKITKALHFLKKKYKKLNFLGPFSGDTLHLLKDSNKRQLLVYLYHDQGLTFFKTNSNLYGANIGLGLPFIRLSVDHGTASDLYLKNKANSLGSIFINNLALQLHKNLK